jgi:phospholipase/carboxylesterase
VHCTEYALQESTQLPLSSWFASFAVNSITAKDTTPMSLLPTIELESAPKPRAAVIWLHGLGADGNDFVPIVSELDLGGCAPIRFIFPSAPSMPITWNSGYVMPAWYDISGSDLVSKQDAQGIAKSALAINALIEDQFKKGIDYKNIVLAGFSQGCAMALHTGLSFHHPLAGIIALSGYLPLADSFKSVAHPSNQNTPIFMAHGTQDPVVVIKRGEDSRDLLKSCHYTVDWHTYPMAHSVHPNEISDISTFLRQVLAA